MKSLTQYINESRISLINKGNVKKFVEKDGMTDKIKPWYHETFKTDDAWEDIDDEISFGKLLSDMVDGKETYDSIGISDSIVRERVFKELTKRSGARYNDIYYLWLNND